MKMKTVIKNSIVAIIISALPLALTAADTETKYRGYTASVIDTLPVPVERTIPVVEDELLGATVVLKVTVDEFGIPTRIDTAPLPFEIGLGTDNEQAFIADMKDSVSSWDFTPAVDKDGNPMEVTVRMPVTVIEHNGEQKAHVSVILDRNFAYIHG